MSLTSGIFVACAGIDAPGCNKWLPFVHLLRSALQCPAVPLPYATQISANSPHNMFHTSMERTSAPISISESAYSVSIIIIIEWLCPEAPTRYRLRCSSSSSGNPRSRRFSRWVVHTEGFAKPATKHHWPPADDCNTHGRLLGQVHLEVGKGCPRSCRLRHGSCMGWDEGGKA